MDLQKRNQVIQKVFAIYAHDNMLPVVSLEEFFDGNDDDYSIAVNLDPHPGVATFAEVLQRVKAQDDVQDVFVEIHECPEPDDSEDDDIWMTSMVVFIITSASLNEIQDWLQPLQPDLIHEGWHVTDGVITPIADDELGAGMQVIRVWWD
jgi:hypothetical protein